MCRFVTPLSMLVHFEGLFELFPCKVQLNQGILPANRSRRIQYGQTVIQVSVIEFGADFDDRREPFHN